MSDKKIELNRRRVLGGLITVGGAAAAAGAGTFALFSDTEQSSGNTITAGTLDLALNPNSSASTPISFTNLKPGDSGTLAIELGNTGNINGDLTAVKIGSVSGGTFSANLVTDSDGTGTDFESNPTGDGGELDDNLTVDAFLEPSGSFTGSVGTTQGSTTTRSGSETNIVTSGTVLANAIGSNSLSTSLNPPETKYFVLNYNLPSGTGNVVQGDSVEFDVQFQLDQA